MGPFWSAAAPTWFAGDGRRGRPELGPRKRLDGFGGASTITWVRGPAGPGWGLSGLSLPFLLQEHDE